MAREERWMWIDGYEGKYEVSNKGIIKSYAISKKGNILKDRLNKSGYKHVALRRDNKATEFLVARLVAHHFIEKNNNPDITVNHKNGIKTDDNVENLEWMDRSNQMYHAYELGLKKPRKYKPILTYQEAQDIKKVYSKGTHGCSALALSKKYGVSDKVIHKIVNEIPPYDYQ